MNTHLGVSPGLAHCTGAGFGFGCVRRVLAVFSPLAVVSAAHVEPVFWMTHNERRSSSYKVASLHFAIFDVFDVC